MARITVQDIQADFVIENFRYREALKRIIKLDMREANVCINSDPAGNTYRVEEFPGPCAKIAMEALGVEEPEPCR